MKGFECWGSCFAALFILMAFVLAVNALSAGGPFRYFTDPPGGTVLVLLDPAALL